MAKNNEQITAYLKLARLFKDHGFSLYLVGGTVRDYLLRLPLTDMDAVTNATPIQMNAFLKEANNKFMKYGYIKYQVDGIKFDITTLRIESKYKDYRHPSKIKYVDSLKKDYVRRDFTINAMYLDDLFVLYDYSSGQEDLKNKIIRLIGNPKKRIKEDPLRILRAIRFSLEFGFSFDEKTAKAMKKYAFLLKKLNKEKIKEEIHKFPAVDEAMKNKLFTDFAIHQYIDVIE